jgi:hypothetical protein
MSGDTHGLELKKRRKSLDELVPTRTHLGHAGRIENTTSFEVVFSILEAELLQLRAGMTVGAMFGYTKCILRHHLYLLFRRYFWPVPGIPNDKCNQPYFE